VIARLEWLVTGASARHDDRDDVVDRGVIDIVHDQDLQIAEVRLGVDVGIRDWLAVSASLPVRMVTSEIQYLDTTGEPVELVTPGIHHRNETLTGLADPMVTGAVTARVGGWRLTGRAGLTIPIGATEEDPFALGDMGLAHQHIQMGTGTFNPVVGGEVVKTWGRWGVGGFALTQQVVYENGKGYHAGDRYAGGVSVIRTFAGDHAVRAGVEVLGETAERWNGVMHSDDGNRGRFDAMIVAAYSTRLSDMRIHAGVKIPVVTRVVGGQLEVPLIAEVGWSYTFGGGAKAREEDEHEHDHDHEHDHGDHADHADHDEHEERALEPVPDKITIFDFWASWCEPCKVLEPALAEMQRAHPERVAVVKLDVSDDPPEGVTLPHVKVFDEKGVLVLERSSAPGELDALIAAVRAIVEPAAPVVAPEPEPEPELPTPTPTPTPTPKRIAIEVNAGGFSPANVTVKRGQAVVLVFERKTDKTCATEVLFTADGNAVKRDLPLGKRVAIPITFSTAGTIKYGCAMDMMIHGTITVK
jgi:thiol-disulfide isomerase/thioredoxin